jgi:hypothetical protein
MVVPALTPVALEGETVRTVRGTVRDDVDASGEADIE